MPHNRWHIACNNDGSLPADFSLPGDIWAFAGQSFYSKMIRLSTCSLGQWWYGETPSHIAISSEYNPLVYQNTKLITGHSKYIGQVLLFESTELVDLPCCLTGKKTAGVQAHPILQRISNYTGTVWRYRLDPDWKLTPTQSQILNKFLLEHLGEDYDAYDAVLSATIRLRLARFIRHDLKKRFCSDLVLDALRHTGILDHNFSPKTYNPARSIMDLTSWDILQPICLCQKRVLKCQSPCESVLIKTYEP